MCETMKCILKTQQGKGNLALARKPRPIPRAGEVLIRVHMAAICGTDVHIYEWAAFAASRMKPPIVIGHEFCGEIIAVGQGVDIARIGELVSAESHVACHRCALCLDGKENLCLRTKCIGVHIDGCFAEYITIPQENALPYSQTVPHETAAMLEPLGVAVYAATRAEIAGQGVAVVGCGPIGLMTVAVAKKMGAKKILCLEMNDVRAKAARSMGADVVIDPLRTDCIEAVRAEFEGIGPDVALEFSGSEKGIRAALQYLRPGGKMVAGGLPARDVAIDFEQTFYRGIDILGLSGREMYHTWKVMFGLLDAGLDVSGVVSHVLPLEQYEEAFALIHQGKALKVLLEIDRNGRGR